MNLSMKWLSDFVKLKVEPRDFSEKMSMSGSKVEGWKIEGEEIKNVVVGKILSVDPHPDADQTGCLPSRRGRSRANPDRDRRN